MMQSLRPKDPKGLVVKFENAVYRDDGNGIVALHFRVDGIDCLPGCPPGGRDDTAYADWVFDAIDAAGRLPMKLGDEWTDDRLGEVFVSGFHLGAEKDATDRAYLVVTSRMLKYKK